VTLEFGERPRARERGFVVYFCSGALILRKRFFFIQSLPLLKSDLLED
jgi:hypothetical protein